MSVSLVLFSVAFQLTDRLIVIFHPKCKKAELFEKQLELYNSQFEDKWKKLKGVRLEKLAGELFKKMGYRVELTPVTGDAGIDLILYKSGEKIVVQCKGHKKPVGPKDARELFGALHSTDANKAILISTNGFTQGVLRFIRQKPIELLSSKEIAKMSQKVHE